MILTKLVRNLLIQISIVNITREGEVIFLDQFTNATCVLHAVSKIVKTSIDWHSDFHQIEWNINLEDVIKSLMQEITMDQVRSRGINPMELGDKDIIITVGKNGETISINITCILQDVFKVSMYATRCSQSTFV